MLYHGLLQNWKCFYCFYPWAGGGMRLSALQAEFVWLLPQEEGAGSPAGAWPSGSGRQWGTALGPSGSAVAGPLGEPVPHFLCVISSDCPSPPLSHDPPPHHLTKNSRKLCPGIKVGLFRFYFLKLSSNYQKVFSNLFSNCWKIPMASHLPSPGTENASTLITKCFNHKQRSHFPNHHVYLDWGCL